MTQIVSLPFINATVQQFLSTHQQQLRLANLAANADEEDAEETDEEQMLDPDDKELVSAYRDLLRRDRPMADDVLSDGARSPHDSDEDDVVRMSLVTARMGLSSGPP